MSSEELRNAAEQLALTLPTPTLPAEVAAWFDDPPRAAGAWLVMCSGGADSVALLLWLWGRFPERRADLRVLHVNHGLRGAAAEADAEFVVNLAMGLDLRVRVARMDPKAPSTSEAELRTIRQSVINAACAREAVAAIFTGHQADDVAENLLFRLSREGEKGVRLCMLT